MKNWSRRRHTSVLLVLPLWLASCGSAPTEQVAPVPELDPLEQDAINALELNLLGEAREGLEAALDRYRALDDLEGQWRIHLIRARLAMGDGDRAAAAMESGPLTELAAQIGTRDANFQTVILLGQVNEDREYYRRALGLAATPLERAVVLTYLERFDEARQLITDDLTDNPGDRAFVVFRYAAAMSNEEDYHRALALYKLAEDSRGVADTLFHLARDRLARNDREQAALYARRAANVLLSSGDAVRAEVIEQWLNEL